MLMKDPFSRRAALAAISVATVSCGVLRKADAIAPDKASSFRDAVEALRAAMVAGDSAALQNLLHDHLIYMHSSGHSQTKANLLSDLAGKSFFASLNYAEQTIDVVGDTGVATLMVDQVKNLSGGATRASRLRVLQTWTRTAERWVLLARASALVGSPSAACAPHVGS